ncbi:MAG: hypothetical protein PUD52_03615 [Prevotella sp.]|nr:hypothetical protein [Prevotella sp.]
MENNFNLKFILTTRCVLYIFLIAFIAASCSNKREEKTLMRDFSQRKRAEVFISKLDIQQRLDLLLLETRGDTALLARVLLAPESSVKRLIVGEAQPTKHALKKTSRTFADIKEFNADIIINAALNNKEFPNLKLKQSVWEQ